MLSVTLTRHPVSTLTPAPAVPALRRSAKKMGAIIGSGQHVMYSTNHELEMAIDDALEIARRKDLTSEQADYVERLDQTRRGLFSGYCPHFERLFPTDEEKEFWSRVWDEAAEGILSGELGQRGTESLSRRILVSSWISQTIRFMGARSRVAQLHATERTLNSQDAALADGEDTMLELEWQRTMDEANRRGILIAPTTRTGRVRCPYCRTTFDSNDGVEWNGDRHMSCLTRLELRPPSAEQGAADQLPAR